MLHRPFDKTRTRAFDGIMVVAPSKRRASETIGQYRSRCPLIETLFRELTSE